MKALTKPILEILGEREGILFVVGLVVFDDEIQQILIMNFIPGTRRVAIFKVVCSDTNAHINDSNFKTENNCIHTTFHELLGVGVSKFSYATKPENGLKKC